MKNIVIAVILLFGAAILAPAGIAVAGESGGCEFGVYKTLQAKKSVKEIEATYAGMVKDARRDDKISEVERVTLDFYRLDNGISLAKAKRIENNT